VQEGRKVLPERKIPGLVLFEASTIWELLFEQAALGRDAGAVGERCMDR